MKKFPFLQIDAFTTRPLNGNPCAVVFEADNLDDLTMLAIAREMNLSETAFVRSSATADIGARYFTPAEEIPLAGHPTIATVFGLVKTNRLSLTSNLTTVTLELPAGIIPVEIYTQQGKVQHIVMSQNKPTFLKTYNPADILPLFHLSPEDVMPDVPIQTVSTGTPQLMIPIRNLDALRGAYMNVPMYRQFKERADFFSPHLFCVQGIENGHTFARHFGIPPDTDEDPFTGSATGGMAAYLWHYRLIEQPKFVAEQGHWMQRPGQANVEVIGPPENIATVKVGGQAVIVVRGELAI